MKTFLGIILGGILSALAGVFRKMGCSKGGVQ